MTPLTSAFAKPHPARVTVLAAGDPPVAATPALLDPLGFVEVEARGL